MTLSLSTRTAAALIFLAACQAPPQDAAPETPGAATDLTLTRFRSAPFAFAQYSGYDTPTQLVIRDQAAWTQAWLTLHARLQPVPPIPAVDFDRESVVLVALGTRNTGGYNVLLESASLDGGQVHLTVRQSAPGASCITTQALTQPVDLARLTRRPEPVTFDVRAQVQECR
jgi:hypothetical protein